TVRSDPDRFEILAGWQPWLERLERLHRQSKRQIILTEIGYRSIDGAGLAPFDFAQPGSLDLSEQADLYWAALEATKDLSWLQGVYWWNWPADGSGGQTNRDYTPSNKPAEEELRSRWALVD
ncbi:hypothetical protein MJD09_27990, partial [bacterium]|nr:hypothetical protein [bacterium]